MVFDQDEKIIRWVAGILFAVFAVINGFRFASLILLMAALFVLPIRQIDDFIFRLKPLVVIAVALCLILIGVMTVPQDKIVGNGAPSKDSLTAGTGESTDSDGSDDESAGENKPVGDGEGADSGDGNKDDQSNTDADGDGNNPEGGDNTEENKPDDPDSPNDGVTSDYVLNTNTMKFHRPTCFMVKKIDDKNKEYYTGSRDKLIEDEYLPCGHCDP